MDFELPIYKIDHVNQLVNNIKPNINFKSSIFSLPPNIELSKLNFGIEIETNQFQPFFYSGDIIIFSKLESSYPLQNIYLFTTTSSKPIIGTIIHNPNSTEHKQPRRKNFMTPTPLHIPTSKIAPASEASHARLLIRSVEKKQRLISISRKKRVYTFPMIYIIKNNKGVKN